MRPGIRCHAPDSAASGGFGEPPEIVDFGFMLGMKGLQAAVADAVMGGRALPHPMLVRVELAHRIEVAEARRRVRRLRLAPSDAEGIALAFRDELDTIFVLTGNSAGRNCVYV
jgi:hypothetical protein